MRQKEKKKGVGGVGGESEGLTYYNNNLEGINGGGETRRWKRFHVGKEGGGNSKGKKMTPNKRRKVSPKGNSFIAKKV